MILKENEKLEEKIITMAREKSEKIKNEVKINNKNHYEIIIKINRPFAIK